MSADPNYRTRRWTRAELTGLIAVIWFLSLLLFFVLTVTP